MNECEEVDGTPVVSCCDASEVLELVEEALDAVAPPVGVVIVGDERLSGWVARDDDSGACGRDEGAQGIAVVGLVGDDGAGAEPFEQGRRGRDVAGLSRGEDEAQRSPLAVGQRVDLGGQTSSGTPQSLIAVPPFPVAAC